MKHTPIPTDCPGSHRRGVTLTEVLMSLMIMSIGISSVAVLFPLSMLRSLQATQLTNAALLKISVEQILQERPELIFDPDGDGNLVEHFRTVASRNYVVDPNGFYTLSADGNTFAGQFGNGGVFLQRFGGGLKTLQGVGTPTNPQGIRGLQLAGQSLASNRDGWKTIVDAVPTSYASSTLTFGSRVDLSDTPTSQLLMASVGFVGAEPRVRDPENFQVVLFSANGKFSKAYPLTAVDTATAGAHQAKFTEDLNNNNALDAGEDFNGNGILDRRAVPSEFGTPPVFSRVLIQTRRVSDFTWLLTVRRRGDGAVRNMDVVVKFSDGVDVTTERVFSATFVKGSNVVGVVAPTAGTEPRITKGQFMFDVLNARWYRISDVREEPFDTTATTFDWSTYTYQVFLVEEAVANSGSDAIDDGVLNGSDTSSLGGAMFPPGIIDVYPMGSLPLPTNSN